MYRPKNNFKRSNCLLYEKLPYNLFIKPNIPKVTANFLNIRKNCFLHFIRDTEFFCITLYGTTPKEITRTSGESYPT